MPSLASEGRARPYGPSAARCGAGRGLALQVRPRITGARSVQTLRLCQPIADQRHPVPALQGPGPRQSRRPWTQAPSRSVVTASTDHSSLPPSTRAVSIDVDDRAA